MNKILLSLMAALLFFAVASTAMAVPVQKPSPPAVKFNKSPMRFNNGIMPILKNIAKKLRTKILVTSGYRSPAHNRKVGGAKRSAHLTGNAVDLASSSPQGLASKIYKNGLSPGQVLWNSCRPHVHLAIDRNGHFDECGKVKGRKKKSKVKGKKKKPKKPKKRARKKRRR